MRGDAARFGARKHRIRRRIRPGGMTPRRARIPAGVSGWREALAAEVSGKLRFFAAFELVCARAGVESPVGVSIVAFFSSNL